jgi:hypothetical protein
MLRLFCRGSITVYLLRGFKNLRQGLRYLFCGESGNCARVCGVSFCDESGICVRVCGIFFAASQAIAAGFAVYLFAASQTFAVFILRRVRQLRQGLWCMIFATSQAFVAGFALYLFVASQAFAAGFAVARHLQQRQALSAGRTSFCKLTYQVA